MKVIDPDSMTGSVIDLETSIKNRGAEAVGGMKASPFHPDNKAVWFGSLSIRGKNAVTASTTIIPAYTLEYIVGHNIKFDLLYLKREEEWDEWLKTGLVWDTMIVEYLLSGQQAKFASLDKLSEKYGGELKDSRIKEYWDNNVDTEDIPEDEIVPYLEGDLKNTEIVFLKQYEKAKNLGMLPLITSQMEALLAITEMEYNGMRVDMEKLYNMRQEVKRDYDNSREVLIEAMEKVFIRDPNPDSNDHMSLFFFGGVQKVKEDRPCYDDDGKPIVYKTGKRKGQVKHKKVEVSVSVGRQITPSKDWESKKRGFWKTNNEVLTYIADNLSASTAGDWAKKVLEYRELSKDLTTYYDGLAKHWWPHDGCIHGQLNQCQTDTGRLSSSKPNMQNFSN